MLGWFDAWMVELWVDWMLDHPTVGYVWMHKWPGVGRVEVSGGNCDWIKGLSTTTSKKRKPIF